MVIPLITIIGKLITFISRNFKIGNGGTWPGEIALRIKPDIYPFFTEQVKEKIILIAGTNGKTTTAKLVSELLFRSGKSTGRIIYNNSGANLLNGLVSAFIQNADDSGQIQADFAVLEVDENTLSQVAVNDKKIIVVLLNLFRDQLDRYGEVDSIVRKWQQALEKLPEEALVILNADDPQIAFIGKNLKCSKSFFSLNRPDKYLKCSDHASDSTYCPACGGKLTYKGIYFSHLGDYVCSKCTFVHPQTESESWNSPLPGLYNQYNILAAAAVAKGLNIPKEKIKNIIAKVVPAFGRAEIITVEGKKVHLLLSKNPAGFNATLRFVIDEKPETILLVLNDRIPDGRDVSWIWDVDFEMISDRTHIICSGDRAYDMGLRVKYSQNEKNPTVCRDLKSAIMQGLTKNKDNDDIYILATYSAMLEVRKILKGRKIL